MTNRGAIKKAKADVSAKDWDRASRAERNIMVLRAMMKGAVEEEAKEQRKLQFVGGVGTGTERPTCDNDGPKISYEPPDDCSCQPCDEHRKTQLEEMYALRMQG